MMNLARLWIVLLCWACAPGTPLAQSVPERASLVGTWLVTVEGLKETRTLIIESEGTGAGDSGASLVARYGITTLTQPPVDARVVANGATRQLVVVTQAASVITLDEQPDGQFRGRFVDKSGKSYPAVVARVTPAELAQARAAQARPPTAASIIQPPGPDVPEACAAFTGGWGGEWPGSGFTALWVVSIDAQCSARIVYGGSPLPPRPGSATTDVVVKDGRIELKRPDGGVTTFVMSGPGLDASYAGPGSTNRAHFGRISADPTEAAKLQAELRAQTAPVPVAADVPRECAALHGTWVGTWSQGSTEVYLRVVEVKGSATGPCSVRYTYSTSKAAFPARDTAEVHSGRIRFVCNRTTGGTCVFMRRGDAIEGTYTNPAGGLNDIVLRPS